MANLRLGARHMRHAAFRGDGYFAGRAPDPADPGSPDGRFRVLNVPAQGRVVVLERSTLRVVAATLSAPDGIWEVTHLDRSVQYLVLGHDDTGVQNAAVQDWLTPALME